MSRFLRPSTNSMLLQLAHRYAVPRISQLTARASLLPQLRTCSSRPPKPPQQQSHTIASVQPRILIAFTCKVCNTRNTKHMSKLAYEKGVVMIRCEGCSNTHLIADHLGWFDSLSPPGTIEDILKREGRGDEFVRAKVEDVIRGDAGVGGGGGAAGRKDEGTVVTEDPVTKGILEAIPNEMVAEIEAALKDMQEKAQTSSQ